LLLFTGLIFCAVSFPGPTYLFRRPSVDHIAVSQPKETTPTPSSRAIQDPDRPTVAFPPTNLPRPLSNIPELSNNAGQGDVQINRASNAGTGNDAPLKYNRNHAASAMSLPLSRVPERRSSRARLRRRSSMSRLSFEFPSLPLPPPSGLGHTISERGRSRSPVRSAAARHNAISSTMQRTNTRTFVRPVRPSDILEVPIITHPRAVLELRVSAPLFMGGGTVEGQIHLKLDGGNLTKRRRLRPAMAIGRIAIDILGVEAIRNKQSIFRSLATELLTEDTPPPSTMAILPRKKLDAFWETIPSDSILPFQLNLPINMGPPSYSSKSASIRYVLCATVVIRISEKVYFARQSQEIAVLTVHDRRLSPRRRTVCERQAKL
jgi:hypothetical protein